MVWAFATTVLFSLSAVFAHRSVRILGSIRANFARLAVACALLACYAHLAGQGVSGPAFGWYFLSGVVGFGIGDLALFLAFPRIGSRLTVLLTQCLAAPFAATIEWSWLGVRPTAAQALYGAVILAGVALALAPGDRSRGRGLGGAGFVAGVVAGVIAALGQGGGAVLSRHAALLAEAEGLPVDGMTAAYQRILGGILFASLTLIPMLARRRSAEATVSPGAAAPLGESVRRGAGWIVVNALAGPVLGVACFQTALLSTPSAIVLPIVALTPIVVMPLSWWLEHDRPTLRALLGAVVAVAGGVALTLTR